MVDNDGNKFTVRVSDSLRSAVNERRLTPVVEAAPQFSIKEIQSRLRAGESYADVSRISGLSLEKIERYASPILQERAWIIELAEKSSPKGTSLPLSDLVIQRLAPRGVNMNQISWNTWRLDDGTWHLVLSYPSRARLVAVRTDPMVNDEPNEVKEITPDAKKDGVTKRISIPSWDDIMFGRSKKKDDSEEE